MRAEFGLPGGTPLIGAVAVLYASIAIAQRRAILTECHKRGRQLVETIEDGGYSGKDLRRPGIKRALEAVVSP